MRGSLSSDGDVVVADGEVTFSKVQWSGVFTFSGPERVTVGDYLLTLEDGRSQSINVTKVTHGTNQETEVVFTRSM